MVFDAGAEERRSAGGVCLAADLVIHIEAALHEYSDAFERARLGGDDECVDFGVVKIECLLVDLGSVL